MMPTPHILLGAAVGTRLRRPWVALPLAYLSHFLMDWIPHLDAAALGPRAGGPEWLVQALGAADFAFGWAIVAFLVWRYRLPARTWYAAGAAILPDVLQWLPGVRGLFGTGGPFLAIGVFHHTFHHSLSVNGWLLGLSTQAAVILFSLYAITRQPHGTAPAPTAVPMEVSRDAVD